jgi:prepilin signal peptidase PulO-like enzyme (type II secretory pathway)
MEKEVYEIPLRYRKMENLHIVFWLFKDISWCMIWRPLGIAMIFPTLIIAIIITLRTRQFMSEVCHNIAIVLWISANSYWMISEFLHFDNLPLIGDITYKQLAIIPFSIGIAILGYYYIWWKPRHKDLLETM